MFFHMVYKSGQIFLPFCQNSRVWRTNGQTDRRTDRILIAIPRLHCMQRGKKRASVHRTAPNCEIEQQQNNSMQSSSRSRQPTSLLCFSSMIRRHASSEYLLMYFIYSFINDRRTRGPYLLSEVQKIPNTYITENYKYKKGNTKQTKNTQ